MRTLSRGSLRRIIIGVIVVSGIFVTGCTRGLTKIADNVYCYADQKNASARTNFGANAGIVIGRDGILVVDTLISAKQAKRFIRDIRAISDKPIKYVINTHSHLDHSFGNSEFAKLDAVIIAQENVKKMPARWDKDAVKNAIKRLRLTEEEMKGTVPYGPNLTMNETMTIDLGDQKVDLIWYGHTHTEDSIVAFLPDKKVLFAGDLLFTGYHANIMDGDMDGWIKALDSIMALNAGIIIPGHGPVSSNKDVQAMKDYLAAFDKTARELAAQNKDAEAIASEIIKAFPGRKELKSMVAFNVKAKYLKK